MTEIPVAPVAAAVERSENRWSEVDRCFLHIFWGNQNWRLKRLKKYQKVKIRILTNVHYSIILIGASLGIEYSWLCMGFVLTFI